MVHSARFAKMLPSNATNLDCPCPDTLDLRIPWDYSWSASDLTNLSALSNVIPPKRMTRLLEIPPHHLPVQHTTNPPPHAVSNQPTPPLPDQSSFPYLSAQPLSSPLPTKNPYRCSPDSLLGQNWDHSRCRLGFRLSYYRVAVSSNLAMGPNDVYCFEVHVHYLRICA
jgi:hypothetical protein